MRKQYQRYLKTFGSSDTSYVLPVDRHGLDFRQYSILQFHISRKENLLTMKSYSRLLESKKLLRNFYRKHQRKWLLPLRFIIFNYNKTKNIVHHCTCCFLLIHFLWSIVTTIIFQWNIAALLNLRFDVVWRSKWHWMIG